MLRLLVHVAAVTCAHAVAAATVDGVPQHRLRVFLYTNLAYDIVSDYKASASEDRIALLDYCEARRCYSVQERSSALVTRFDFV